MRQFTSIWTEYWKNRRDLSIKFLMQEISRNLNQLWETTLAVPGWTGFPDEGSVGMLEAKDMKNLDNISPFMVVIVEKACWESETARLKQCSKFMLLLWENHVGTYWVFSATGGTFLDLDKQSKEIEQERSWNIWGSTVFRDEDCKMVYYAYCIGLYLLWCI